MLPAKLRILICATVVKSNAHALYPATREYGFRNKFWNSGPSFAYSLSSFCGPIRRMAVYTKRNKKLSWCWETRVTRCFMSTGSVPISYRFRD